MYHIYRYLDMWVLILPCNFLKLTFYLNLQYILNLLYLNVLSNSERYSELKVGIVLGSEVQCAKDLRASPRRQP